MESTWRSLAKAVSWRFIATLITGGLVWILTGEPKFAITVGLFDTSIKIFAYVLHERIWVRIPFGLRSRDMEYEI